VTSEEVTEIQNVPSCVVSVELLGGRMRRDRVPRAVLLEAHFADTDAVRGDRERRRGARAERRDPAAGSTRIARSVARNEVELLAKRRVGPAGLGAGDVQRAARLREEQGRFAIVHVGRQAAVGRVVEGRAGERNVADVRRNRAAAVCRRAGRRRRVHSR